MAKTKEKPEIIAQKNFKTSRTACFKAINLQFKNEKPKAVKKEN
jgi:hypothetical protein